MRDQTDNLSKNIYPVGVCVCESERVRERVLSVCSGKCVQQDRFPNIG